MMLETRPMPIQRIREFVRVKIRALLNLQEKPEVCWPDARPDDVWQRTEAVKVYRGGGARAVSGGVFRTSEYDSSEQAMAAAVRLRDQLRADKVQEHEIRVQKTDRRRCAAYCPVASKCSAYQSFLTATAEQAA